MAAPVLIWKLKFAAAPPAICGAGVGVNIGSALVSRYSAGLWKNTALSKSRRVGLAAMAIETIALVQSKVVA